MTSTGKLFGELLHAGRLKRVFDSDAEYAPKDYLQFLGLLGHTDYAPRRFEEAAFVEEFTRQSTRLNLFLDACRDAAANDGDKDGALAVNDARAEMGNLHAQFTTQVNQYIRAARRLEAHSA